MGQVMRKTKGKADAKSVRELLLARLGVTSDARRALAALAALVALAVLALAIALPRIAASEAVRARLVEAVQDATKRAFTVKGISAGLFPPHLELVEPSLAGDAEGPSAAARSAELRLAVLPLLARVVVVRSLRRGRRAAPRPARRGGLASRRHGPAGAAEARAHGARRSRARTRARASRSRCSASR